MKNKKGFTVIELIAIIAVLSLLSVLTVPKIIDSLKKGKDKTMVVKENNVYEAASTYLKDNCGTDKLEGTTCVMGNGGGTVNVDYNYQYVCLDTVRDLLTDDVTYDGKPCRGVTLITKQEGPDSDPIDIDKTYLMCGNDLTNPDYFTEGYQDTIFTSSKDGYGNNIEKTTPEELILSDCKPITDDDDDDIDPAPPIDDEKIITEPDIPFYLDPDFIPEYTNSKDIKFYLEDDSAPGTSVDKTKLKDGDKLCIHYDSSTSTKNVNNECFYVLGNDGNKPDDTGGGRVTLVSQYDLYTDSSNSSLYGHQYYDDTNTAETNTKVNMTVDVIKGVLSSLSLETLFNLDATKNKLHEEFQRRWTVYPSAYLDTLRRAGFSNEQVLSARVFNAEDVENICNIKFNPKTITDPFDYTEDKLVSNCYNDGTHSYLYFNQNYWLGLITEAKDYGAVTSLTTRLDLDNKLYINGNNVLSLVDRYVDTVATGVNGLTDLATANVLGFLEKTLSFVTNTADNAINSVFSVLDHVDGFGIRIVVDISYDAINEATFKPTTE